MRRILTLFLASAVAWPQSPLAASAVGPSESDVTERVKRLYYQGAARFKSADYQGAIESFTEALALSSEAGLEWEIEGALLVNTARAHEKAYGLDSDVTHLRVAREIYQRYLDAAPAHGDDSGHDEIEADLAAVVAQLEQLEDEREELQDGENGNDDDALDPAEPADTPAPEQTDATPPRRGLAIGLLAGGGALVATGAGLIGFGATIEGRGNDTIPDEWVGTPSADDYLEEERRKGVIWMGVGGGLLAVGIASLATGAVFMARHGKRQAASRVSIAPALGRGSLGLWLRASI